MNRNNISLRGCLGAWIGLSAIALGAAAAPASKTPPPPPPEPVTTGPAPIVPAGDYRFVTLDLEKGKPVAPDAKDSSDTLRLWLHVRDGKAVRCVAGAAQRNPRVTKGRRLVCRLAEMDAAGLSINGTAIKGEIKGEVEMPKTTNTTYALNATIQDGAVRGTYTGQIGSGAALQGAVTGRVRADAQIRKENAFSPSKDWPVWNGPNGNFTGTDTPGIQLVDDLKDARLVWFSEAVLRHGISWDVPGHGGFSSPVVGDGKVFFNQYVGSGDVIATGNYDTQDNHVSADDEVYGFDASSGRLLWKQVFKDKSVNGPARDKHCLLNNSGCYYKGKVYMFGFTWRVYCLDANTGKFIWESHIGDAHHDAERQKKHALEKKSVINLSGDGNKFLQAAGGVIFTSNIRGNIIAFDPDTGKTLWTVPGTLPTRWVHESKEFILAAAGKQLQCLDPKTGNALWKVDGIASVGAGCWLTAGDLVLANPSGGGRPKQEGGEIGPIHFEFVRVGPQGAAKVSTGALVNFECVPAVTPIYDGCAFIRRPGHRYDTASKKFVKWGPPVYAVEAATGKERGHVDEGTPFHSGLCDRSYSLAADGRYFYELDGTHGGTHLVMVDAKTVKPMQADWWIPPHRQTGGYDIPAAWPYVEGRLFIRGWEGIYCYDLRKATQ
jgi:outer membrane protein assembly factor BamB